MDNKTKSKNYVCSFVIILMNLRIWNPIHVWLVSATNIGYIKKCF